MAVAVRPARPRAGINYPANLGEFFDWFQTGSDCWAYLVRLRWPDGFRCPACGGNDAWLSKRNLFVCVECQRQTSVLVGTVFEGSRLPLLQWFRAAWLITSRKTGVSASTIQEELGLGSYKTASLSDSKQMQLSEKPHPLPHMPYRQLVPAQEPGWKQKAPLSP